MRGRAESSCQSSAIGRWPYVVGPWDIPAPCSVNPNSASVTLNRVRADALVCPAERSSAQRLAAPHSFRSNNGPAMAEASPGCARPPRRGRLGLHVRLEGRTTNHERQLGGKRANSLQQKKLSQCYGRIRQVFGLHHPKSGIALPHRMRFNRGPGTRRALADLRVTPKAISPAAMP